MCVNVTRFSNGLLYRSEKSRRPRKMPKYIGPTTIIAVVCALISPRTKPGGPEDAAYITHAYTYIVHSVTAVRRLRCASIMYTSTSKTRDVIISYELTNCFRLFSSAIRVTHGLCPAARTAPGMHYSSRGRDLLCG